MQQIILRARENQRAVGDANRRLAESEAEKPAIARGGEVGEAAIARGAEQDKAAMAAYAQRRIRPAGVGAAELASAAQRRLAREGRDKWAIQGAAEQ
eukprot:7778362-Pyramimonas_sp.AAC.1